MRYLLGIPFLNRPDLLRLAVNSVQPLWPHTVIVDNSHVGLEPADWPVEIVRPSVSLSFSQSMNLLQLRALEQDCDALLCMHNDAEAARETPDRLLSLLEEAFAAQRRWGVAFTAYDALVAFNLAMIREVGPWDAALPQYFADNDYYRRIRLNGFEVLDTGLPVTHHNNASSTTKSDSSYAYVNGVLFPLQEQYYAAKWGGHPNGERFARPFDGAPAVWFVNQLLEQALFQRLAASYETVEGTLLERADQDTTVAQVQAIRHAVWLTRPRRILETGTAKCMFGYLLAQLLPQATLYTFDGDPRCAASVELLSRSQSTLRVVFTLGDSKETVPQLDVDDVQLAWIDGGHDLNTALSDLRQAMRLRVALIAIDDTRTMPEVAEAVQGALALDGGYEPLPNPYYAEDSRGIAFLRRRG